MDHIGLCEMNCKSSNIYAIGYDKSKCKDTDVGQVQAFQKEQFLQIDKQFSNSLKM